MQCLESQLKKTTAPQQSETALKIPKPTPAAETPQREPSASAAVATSLSQETMKIVAMLLPFGAGVAQHQAHNLPARPAKTEVARATVTTPDASGRQVARTETRHPKTRKSVA